MIRKISFGALAGLATLAFTAPAQAEDVVLKVSSCLIKTHDQLTAYFETFHNPINAMKAGLRLDYIGGPEVTPWQKQAAALKRGLVDMINCPSAYYQGQVPAARVAGVNTVPVKELHKNGGYDLMQDAWKKGLNAKILGWGHWEASTFFIYTLFEPKQNAKTGIDLTGRKMRSTGLYNALFKALGATPVTMAPGDVYAGLERGVVDGVAWPEGSVAAYGWEKFLKYKIAPNFYHSTTMTIINLDSFNKLSKKHQDILVKQGLVYEDKSNAVLAKASEIDNAKLVKAGVKTIELKGDIAKAYLNTIYSAKWDTNDQQKYNVDYKLLKSKVYGAAGGS
jgi:TRAP-type C4-dicarboxylate transport system substrate-binding protein